MKLAVFPKCYVNEIVEGKISLSQWIEMASGLGVDGLELYDKFLESAAPDYLAEVRNRIAAKGLDIPMMCYSPDFTHPDPDWRSREIAGQADAIRITAELGGRFCRILSGQKRPEVSVDDGIRWTVEAIQASLETAREHGIVLVMENHYKDGFWEHPEFAQRSEVFLAIIGQIDSPFFGVQYDPSNAIVAGEDPLELLERVKHRVKTMHASDRYLAPGTTLAEIKQVDGVVGYSSKLCHGVVGNGLNDYDTIFKTLREAGFDGWISIEDGINGMEELRESVAFLRDKMSEYQEVER